MGERDAIAAFYEAHPYPPPVDDLDAYRDRWNDDTRRRAEFHRHFPERPFSVDLNILVAGCGTSQAARHALRWPEARVTGIDVSETSLHATELLRERYSLENLSLHRLPIERAAELEDDFDLIICTGVLHHLADPGLGLEALSKAVRPQGALHLMVYGRYGRTGVDMVQQYARLLGLEPDADQVRSLAETIREIPLDHPLSPMLRGTPDFRSPDALADAFLNPRERSYAVPELLDLLGAHGLRLRRWYHQAPYRAECGAPATTPHAEQLAALTDADQFAAMELFRGTMSRHTAVAVPFDVTDTEPTLSVTDDTVPIRIPDAITVEEGAPPGAAAVLINTAHTYTDLVMAITAAEKEVVDRIDGERSLADIAEAIDTDWASDGEQIRAFARRLWSWDQIVVDNSRAPLDLPGP